MNQKFQSFLLLAGKCLLSFVLFCVMEVATLYASIMIAFTTARPGLYVLLLVAAVLLLYLVMILRLWGVSFAKKARPFLLGGMAVCVLAAVPFLIYDAYIASIPQMEEPRNLIDAYAPFGSDSKVVVMQEPATLTLDGADGALPRLDGATALFPVYAAFARAVYPHHELTPIQYFEKPGLNVEDLLLCTTTPTAYQRLIQGDADMIFVAAASELQKKAAAEQGVELIFTPIGKEAFVFFVNTHNPVDSLTLEQIKGIYSGKITDWDKLGAPSMGSIKAFQRPEGSGSQTALQGLMAGSSLVTAPTEDVQSGMGDIINRTADYRNFRNAIGYSFRFYSTEMAQNDQIKLLAIDGIHPTKETIRDGSYPISSEFYAVTTQNSNPSCSKLLEWILSPQGQSIITQTGYVGMN